MYQKAALETVILSSYSSTARGLRLPGTDFIITNYHVASAFCKSLDWCYFSIEVREDKVDSIASNKIFEPQTCSQLIDLCILIPRGSEEIIELPKFGQAKLGEKIFLLPHSSDFPNEHSLIEGRVLAVESFNILADLPSRKGYSGSPVYNALGEVVGFVSSTASKDDAELMEQISIAYATINGQYTQTGLLIDPAQLDYLHRHRNFEAEIEQFVNHVNYEVENLKFDEYVPDLGTAIDLHKKIVDFYDTLLESFLLSENLGSKGDIKKILSQTTNDLISSRELASLRCRKLDSPLMTNLYAITMTGKFLIPMLVVGSVHELSNCLKIMAIDQGVTSKEGKAIARLANVVLANKSDFLNPETAYDNESLASIYYQLKQYSESVKYFEKAIEGDYYNVGIAYRLANSYYNLYEESSDHNHLKKALHYLASEEFHREDTSPTWLELAETLKVRLSKIPTNEVTH